MALKITASMRNWVRMSRPCAPTAMRTPISRVRSVTLTSMMFMMPMPPTIERDAGNRTQQQTGHDVDSRGGGLGDLLLVAHGEVVVASGADVVPLAKQFGNLLLRRREIVGRGDLDIDVAQGCPTDDAFHRAGVGHDDDVVLVRALRAEAFRREHAGNRKRDP